MNKHEAMQITDCMCKNNNFFVKNNIRNTYKMEFSDHLWLLFLYYPQPYVIFFAIIYLWDVLKHCNIIETWNIYKWYNYIQWNLITFTRSNCRTDKHWWVVTWRCICNFKHRTIWYKINTRVLLIIIEGKTFEFSYRENSIHNDHSIFMVYWWGRYS